MPADVVLEGNAAGEINALMARLSDYSQLLPFLGEMAMDSQKKDIEESRSPAGKKYPDLKNPRPTRLGGAIHDMFGEVVRHQVVEHPYAEKPLLDTTAMYQSIHFQYHGSDEVWAGPSLEDAPYFPFQNQGTARGIPARVFIGLRGEDIDTIRDATMQHVYGALPS